MLEKIKRKLGLSNGKKVSGAPKKERKVDPVLLGLFIVLILFGLVMITSLGVPKSIELSNPISSLPRCDDAGVDCYKVLKNHVLRLGVGMIFLILFSVIPYQFWKKTSAFWFYAAVIFLFVVLIIGSRYTTFARSWLVFFNTSLQPTEFAKLGIVFYLASWMEKRKAELQTWQLGFLPFTVIAGLITLPILLQPDLGGTLVVSLIAITMYYLGGASLKHIGAIVATIFFASVIIVSSVGHVRERFMSFWEADRGICKEDTCYQTWQAEIAIGSGGLMGKGLTQGVQKSYWLPQAIDDFIFAASAEELGFIPISMLVIVYALIAYRGVKIAKGTEDRFAELMAYGLSAWITFQAFVNIAVNTALMPVTGITLPFISYGGSSLVSVMMAAGILLQISKHSNYESSINRRGDRRTYISKYSNR